MNSNKFLYEIIEDYKESNSIKEKDSLFQEFCNSLWKSNNKRRTFVKCIRFKVRDDLLDTEVGKIFNTWSIVEYKTYKQRTKENEWYDLIRQKINNLYTRYFDETVILNKEYMDLLKTPYTLYYRWIKGTDINSDRLTEIIDNAIYNAENVKIKYQNQKMKMSWQEYKRLIEDKLRIIFDNCMTISEYEEKHGVPRFLDFDKISTEDNFYIKYICKSLELHMRNYQKEYYNLKRGRNKQYIRCKECGKLIEKTGNKKQYCKECAKKRERERKKINAYKYRKCSVAK